MRTDSRTNARAFRWVGALLALAGAWFLLGYGRTQVLGFAPGTVLFGALFSLPLALLPWVGTGWRRALTRAALTVLVAGVAVEWRAQAEEHAFRQRHASRPAEAGVVAEGRAWPFSHHHLLYEPRTGFWGAGD
jgi:hypothetical protein